MEFAKEFYYDEVRDGFYIPGIIKRAWATGLKILYIIDEICEKYGISYYLTAGTLLGAIRQGDFIPWDDDVDIAMLRKDFEIFSRIVQAELPEGLAFTSLATDKDRCDFVAGVGTTNSGIKSKAWDLEFPYPVAVDIFVLDELSLNPEDESFRLKMLQMFMVMISGIIHGKEKTRIFQEELQKIEQLLQIQFDKTRPLEPQLYHIMDRIFREFNGEGGKDVVFFPDYLDKRVYFPKSAFREKVRIPFCNNSVPAPKGYELVLRAMYGDYRKRVKAGGGHAYPFFKQNEIDLQERIKGTWKFLYSFSEEDLQRPAVQSYREIVLETAEKILDSYKKILQEFVVGNLSYCLNKLMNCQEEAIAFGNAIEKKKGEGTETVSYLEKYCEALFYAYQRIEELYKVQEILPSKTVDKEGELEERRRKEKERSFLLSLPAGLFKDLERELKKPGYYLKKMRSALARDFKRQVVFLPHRIKHFESLRPLIDALRETGEFDCKIMPIPYYDRLGDGSLSEMHYEGEDFAKAYEICDYRDFDFARELPDAIVLNSPYDECNQTFTVDPFFYSKEMKKYTRKLVYIPWFVTDEISPQKEEYEKDFVNMDYYVKVPGLFHADLSIVQSKEMKSAYLTKIATFTNKEIRKKMSKKISGAGSCLFKDKKGQGTKELVRCVKDFIVK